MLVQNLQFQEYHLGRGVEVDNLKLNPLKPAGQSLLRPCPQFRALLLGHVGARADDLPHRIIVLSIDDILSLLSRSPERVECTLIRLQSVEWDKDRHESSDEPRRAGIHLGHDETGMEGDREDRGISLAQLFSVEEIGQLGLSVTLQVGSTSPVIDKLVGRVVVDPAVRGDGVELG